MATTGLQFVSLVALAHTVCALNISLGYFKGWPGYVRTLTHWDPVPAWPADGWDYLSTFVAEPAGGLAPKCFWVCRKYVPAFRDLFRSSLAEVLSDEACDASLVDGTGSRIHSFCVGNSSATAPGAGVRMPLRFVVAAFKDYRAEGSPEFMLMLPESLLATGEKTPLSMPPLVAGWGHAEVANVNKNMWTVVAEFWAEPAEEPSLFVCPGVEQVFDTSLRRCRGSAEVDVLVRRDAPLHPGLYYFSEYDSFLGHSSSWHAGFRARSFTNPSPGDSCYCVVDAADGSGLVQTSTDSDCVAAELAFCAALTPSPTGGQYQFVLLERSIGNAGVRHQTLLVDPDLGVGAKAMLSLPRGATEEWTVAHTFWASPIGPMPACGDDLQFSQPLLRCASPEELPYPVGYYASSSYRMYFFPLENVRWPNAGWEYLTGVVGKRQGSDPAHDLCFTLCRKTEPMWRHRLVPAELDPASLGCDMSWEAPKLCVASAALDTTYVRFVVGSFINPTDGSDTDFLWMSDALRPGDAVFDPPALVQKEDMPVSMNTSINHFTVSHVFWARPMPGPWLPARYLPCWGGYYKSPSMASCARCPQGRYRDISDYDMAGCFLCPDLASTITEATLRGSECTCEGGHVMTGNVVLRADSVDLDGSRCEACPPGRYGPPGFNECFDCPEGTFAATNRSSVCNACVAGTFANLTGATSCDPCEAGTYGPGIQSSRCFPCAPGYSQASKASTNCEFCGLREYQDEDGSTDCKVCVSPAGGTTETVGSMNASACGCGAGSYLVTSLDRCIACSPGVTCDAFDQEPLVAAGYYMQSTAPRDVHPLAVFMCPQANPQQCPGQLQPGDAVCNPYVQTDAINCGLCEEGHFLDSGQCKPCGKVSIIAAVVIIVGFLFLGGIHWLWNNHSDATEEVGEAVLASSSISTTFTFFQSLGVLHILQVNWPTDFIDLAAFSKLFLFDFELCRISCMFHGRLSIGYIIRLLVPLFIAVCFPLWWGLSVAVSRLSNRFPLFTGDGVFNSLGMVFQTVYISIASSTWTILECYDNPNGNTTVRSFPYVVCWSEEHQRMFPVMAIALVVYVLGIPACLGYLSWVAPRQFVDKGFQRRVKFIVFKFRADRWWYACVVLARALVISLVPTIFPTNGYFQFLLSVFVFIAAICVHLVLEPYQHLYNNNLESVEILCLIAILCFSTYFMMDIRREPGADRAMSLMLILTTAGNFIFLGVILAWALYRMSSPTSARVAHAKRVERALPKFRNISAIIAGGNEDEIRCLISNANYVDRKHLHRTLDYVGLELLGLMPEGYMSQRLPKISSTVSDNRISVIERQASQAVSGLVQKSLTKTFTRALSRTKSMLSVEGDDVRLATTAVEAARAADIPPALLAQLQAELDARRTPADDALHTQATNMWIYTPCVENDIAIRSRPAIDGEKAGGIMSAGQTFQVSEERKGDDNVTFLKLADGRGWLFDQKPGVGTMCMRQAAALAPSQKENVAAVSLCPEAAPALAVLPTPAADPDEPAARVLDILEEFQGSVDRLQFRL